MTEKLAIFNTTKPPLSKTYLMQVRAQIQSTQDIDALMQYLTPILERYYTKPCDAFFIAHDLMEHKDVQSSQAAIHLIQHITKVAMADRRIPLQMRRFMQSKITRFKSAKPVFKPVGKHSLGVHGVPRTTVLPEFDQNDGTSLTHLIPNTTGRKLTP